MYRRWRDLMSAYEYTPIGSMPIMRQVRATRIATSPRFAMRTRRNIDVGMSSTAKDVLRLDDSSREPTCPRLMCANANRWTPTIQALGGWSVELARINLEK